MTHPSVTVLKTAVNICGGINQFRTTLRKTTGRSLAETTVKRYLNGFGSYPLPQGTMSDVVNVLRIKSM